MKLSDLSIRRPVLASMLSLALVLFGVLGFLKLSVREYPDIDPPPAVARAIGALGNVVPDGRGSAYRIGVGVDVFRCLAVGRRPEWRVRARIIEGVSRLLPITGTILCNLLTLLRISMIGAPRMRILKLLGSRAFVLAHDVLSVPLAIFAALFILGDLRVSTGWWSQEVAEFIAVALVTHAAAYVVVGSYRGIWRYAALPDLYRLMVAVAMGTVGTAILWALMPHELQAVPRATFVLYPGILLGVLTVSRVAFRAYNDRISQSESPHLVRALIVGAGRAGDLLVRDMIRTGTFDPVGFLDDEPAKYGHEVQGVRVLGRIDELPRLLAKHTADVVLIAMPSAPKATMVRVVQMCLAKNVDCRK